MKVNIWIRFCVVFGLIFSMQSTAFAKADLYRGVVLAEELTEDRLRALALKQVLVKVSGNASITKLDESKALVRKIPSMLAQFGFKEIDGTRFYYALFDKRKIDNALINMRQPIWGETRPQPLIWLVNEHRQMTSEDMINSRQDSGISSGFKYAELSRGITAQFPLIDLDDSLVIAASDITGRFYQTVASASTRYGAEYFVLANLEESIGGKWQLQWELIQPNAQTNEVIIHQTSQGSKVEIVSDMFNQISDYYAKQFAIIENNGEKLTQVLTIKNVNSLADLSSLHHGLSELNAIDDFVIGSIHMATVSIQVTLKGGLNSLENALSVQPNLQRDQLNDIPFYYHWRQ